MRALIPSSFLAVVLIGTSSLSPGKDPAADAPKNGVANQLVGFWGVNADKTKIALEKAAEEAEEEEKEELELIATMIAEMAKSLVLEFNSKFEAIGYTADGEDPSDFVIVKEDPATGEFTMEIKEDDDDNDKQTAICRLQGDDLRMTMKGQAMIIHFDRLSAKKGKERIAQIRKEAEGGEDDK